MYINKDYFEEYLDFFPDAPSLVLVRSVELKNYPKQNIKHPILDLCCGDGFFSKCLGLSDIYGCDLDPSVIKKAENTNIYKELKICDVKDLSVYQSGYFKTVLSNCALEHVEEIENVLSELKRVLADDGYLIMTVPSELLFSSFSIKKFLELIGLKNLGKQLLDEYNKKQAHRNILSLYQWEKLLNKAGLIISDTFYLFDKKSYKIVMFYEWLFTLRAVNVANRFFKLIFSHSVRKAFWRTLLKKYYLSSLPLLDEGGELVIVAKNEK